MASGKKFFIVYTSLKLHFTTAYDVFKYGGKGAFTKTKLDEKKYSKLFEQWGGRFQSETKMGQFILANIIYGNQDFVYQPYHDAEQFYLKWVGIKDTITKTLSDDLKQIEKTGENYTFDYLCNITPKGNLPPLLQLAIFNKIKLETLVIIHKEVSPIFDIWEKSLYNDPYAINLVFKLKKYVPFVKYNQEKVLPILDNLRGKSGKE